MRYSIPSEFTDENKWLRFFSTKSLIVLLICLSFTLVLWKVASKLGFGIPILVFCIFISVVITALTMIPVPETEYLKGGGLTLDVILMRKFIRKKKQVIYVRGYGKDSSELH